MPAPTSGLARVTIRAPRRRLDLAIPHQVPLVELLPEVLRRAGEVTPGTAGPGGGWVLRRGDGASLSGGVALAHQGVHDGDVLYLVPANLTWPAPDYDDVVEEIAAGARARSRTWNAATTRLFCLVVAGSILLRGLGMLLAAGAGGPRTGLATGGVAVVLLFAGTLLSRAVGDGVAGAVAAGCALPYAAVSGISMSGGSSGTAALSAISPDQLVVGAAALLLASVVGAAVIGYGLRVFVAGMTVGLLAGLGGLLGFVVSGPGAAAVLTVGAVGGIGLAPLIAVRLGRLPMPVVTAAPDQLAAEHRPTRPEVLAAVIRADEILAGSLLGVAAVVVGCTAVLSATTGIAGRLLSVLASVALLLRGRLFPSLASRLPLLGGGLTGLAVTAWLGLAGELAHLVVAACGLVAVVVLLATAVTAHRRRASPYLARLAAVTDNVAVVALAPVACAVLDLYRFARTFAG